MAYVARFVPLATRSANAALRQIDVSLEEAARITGASWSAPSGASCCRCRGRACSSRFSWSSSRRFSELSATILLYTGGTETISVAIYRLNDLGQLEVVAALAVFTIAVVWRWPGCVNWLSGRVTSGEPRAARG